jgi:UDP-glucose 4-epimerase
VLAALSESTDEFYNVGTGVQTSIRDLCDTILDLTQSDLTVTYRPYSAEDSRRMVQNRVGSTAKCRRDLGFHHTYGLRDGLTRLIQWRAESGVDHA